MTLPIEGCACDWRAPLRLRARLKSIARTVAVLVFLLLVAAAGCSGGEALRYAGAGLLWAAAAGAGALALALVIGLISLLRGKL